jgi:SNF2 family DNA or RNA helicase
MKPFYDQQVAIDKFRGVSACLIGDAMGTGKTITAIGRDFQIREDDPECRVGPTLIISEKIGLSVWLYHLKAMGVPEDAILVVDPTDRRPFVGTLRRLQKVQGGKGVNKVRGGVPRYYIMHWDILKAVEEINEKSPSGKPRIEWLHVIADEVQLAKNRKAIRTVELKRIVTRYKTGLSGTPADDKPWDIWSILHWLYPHKFRSYWKFFENYVEYKVAPGRGYRIPTGLKNIDELHRIMRPFYIRRTLREVAPDMPEKIHVQPPIIVPMGKQQRREYDSMKERAIALIGAQRNGEGGFQLLAPAVVAVLTRLQQMALATLSPEWDVKDDDYAYDEFDVEWDFPKIVLSKPSPKLDAVMNLITTHEDEPFVVFTQFKGMADLVEEECQRLKIPVVKITGDVTSAIKRTQMVADFQEGKARVFVGTIAAAGKTITLTRANHCIFVDLSWRPTANEQAEDRLWRRTQKNTVRIYHIQSKDSIDQVRLERINQKADMISALLNPGKLA